MKTIQLAEDGTENATKKNRETDMVENSAALARFGESHLLHYFVQFSLQT